MLSERAEVLRERVTGGVVDVEEIDALVGELLVRAGEVDAEQAAEHALALAAGGSGAAQAWSAVAAHEIVEDAARERVVAALDAVARAPRDGVPPQDPPG